MENKFYYKIDVPGTYGYSFMVVCDCELDEGAVLDKAYSMGYFTDDEDVYYAIVDDLVTPYDIEHFEKNDCVYKIN